MESQLKKSIENIEDELGLYIPIAGLVKDERHRTSQLLFGDPIEPVELKRTSDAFYLLQRIQDEVHRFAITFLRQQRQTSTITSALDGIEGVGPKRKQQLMRHFGSIKKIKEASVIQLIESGIPIKVAQVIFNHFQVN